MTVKIDPKQGRYLQCDLCGKQQFFDEPCDAAETVRMLVLWRLIPTPNGLTDICPKCQETITKKEEEEEEA